MTAAKAPTPIKPLENDGRSLHRKLAQVMYEVERIPKRGKAPAAMGGFEFVQVGDAADVIRKALAEHAVSMIPSSIELIGESEHATSSGKMMTTMTVRTTWTLTDGDSGETAVIQSMGSGADMGDKAAPKAQSNAMKYALLMGFLLSTGDDPELSDSSDRRPKRDGGALEPMGPTGPDIEPTDGANETLRPLGPITRVGAVAKGSGRHSDLEWRQTPDGWRIGFLLEVGDGKPRPQVVVEGPLAFALFTATSGGEQSLEGSKVTVSGNLFEVRVPQRRMVYRIVTTGIETDEWRIPATEAPTEPLPFTAEEQAAILAREKAEAAT